MPVGDGGDPSEELAAEDALIENSRPPESVEPGLSSTDPVESDQGPSDAHPGPDAQAAEAPSDVLDGEEPLPEFDPRVREEFEGMLYLGRLTRDFQFAGHYFTIRTMLIEDILEVALISKEFAGTLADTKAYQAAICAAITVTLDGRPLPQPLTSDPADTPMRNKFNYIKANWYPWVLDAVYEQFLILEDITLRILKAMSDAAPLGQVVPTGTST